jgi:hypothetical protein
MGIWTPFDKSTLTPELKVLYQHYEEIGYSAYSHFVPNAQNFNCHFTNQSTFNAQVRKVNNSFEVGINIAVPAILHFTLNNLFRVSSFMPFIGIPSKDEESRGFPSQIPLKFPNDVLINEFIHDIIGTSRPKDYQRAIAASSLTNIAVSFVIYHEVAHIILGHVNALHTCFHESEHMELVTFSNSTRSEPYDDELRQIWEFEADTMASTMFISDMLSSENMTFIKEAQGLSETENITTMENIAFSLIAILTFFLIQNQSIEKQRIKTHPSPDIRFCAVVSEIMAHLEQYYPNLILQKSIFQKLIDNTMINVVTAWNDLNFTGANLIDYSSPEKTIAKVKALDLNRKKRCELYKNHAIKYLCF